VGVLVALCSGSLDMFRLSPPKNGPRHPSIALVTFTRERTLPFSCGLCHHSKGPRYDNGHRHHHMVLATIISAIATILRPSPPSLYGNCHYDMVIATIKLQ
jgi:hypothetical protein